jgi:hypothetical protein
LSKFKIGSTNAAEQGEKYKHQYDKLTSPHKFSPQSAKFKTSKFVKITIAFFSLNVGE